MKKSQRFKLLTRLAADGERKAAQGLGQSHRRLMEQQTRLNELRNYRAEYAQQFQHLGAQGMDVTRVQIYQRFLEQLDRAIVLQEHQVSAATSDCETHRSLWQAQHTRTQGLDNIVQYHQINESRQEARQEQNDLDEISTQKTQNSSRKVQ